MIAQKHASTSYIFITTVRRAGIFLYQYCTSFLRQREKVLLDTLKTNFGYIKFWVKIQPQSEKSYHFCWISINFVHQNLFKKLFFNEPEWLFFYPDEEARYPVKLTPFYGSGPCMRFKKVLLQSPEVEWCAKTSCQWHPMTETLSFKFHKWTGRLL